MKAFISSEAVLNYKKNVRKAESLKKREEKETKIMDGQWHKNINIYTDVHCSCDHNRGMWVK